MARVAALQDHSQAERARYVYVQHATVSSRRGHTIHCQEITDIRITPFASGSHEQLLDLSGRLLRKGRYLDYHSLEGEKGQPEDNDPVSIRLGDDATDRDMVENMRKNLLGTNSKDGINANLFPLTTKEQADEEFHYVGRERLNGRDVDHVAFRPRDKSDFGWKGDAYIDTVSGEPVVVSTALSRRIPAAVRVLLGTNVPGLGFTVVYAPQPDGIWFPTSFSTEFQIHVLFFFRRTILINAWNRDFEKTHVTANIVGKETRQPPTQP
ncbi:MAG TPA: hypothetical protein VFE06_16475 [Acidobacteriaceae bacterium]|nr:hypothetical protein [Acidobacteriaceae bacterium]